MDHVITTLHIFLIYTRKLVMTSFSTASFNCSFEKLLIVGLQPTLLKKWLRHRCFPVNFAKFLRTPFLTEHLRWLLLFISIIIFQSFSFLWKTTSPLIYTNSCSGLKSKNRMKSYAKILGIAMCFSNFIRNMFHQIF